ncbi:hypothetical protein F4861DRAFT_506692 [Xylaria intraflava]|nr:hypothetical protein F4861DRAFT_506692 [Xylaria intraflava]
MIRTVKIERSLTLLASATEIVHSGWPPVLLLCVSNPIVLADTQLNRLGWHNLCENSDMFTTLTGHLEGVPLTNAW